MARVTDLARGAVVGLLLASVSTAQETALERVKNESDRVRQLGSPPGSDIWDDSKVVRDRLAGFHAAIRDWVGHLLPKSKAALDAELFFLDAKLQAELHRSKLIASVTLNDKFEPGFVTRVEVLRPPDDRDKLVVIAGVGVPCGEDDAVYVYDYSSGQPRRVLESHGTRSHDETLSDVRFSKRDAIGNQLIVTLRYGVQCGSAWNALSYDLFRLSPSAHMALPIFAGEQGIYFGADNPYQLRAGPDELLMEVRDRSIDSGIHNRAHVLHFKLARSSVERIDPVALQPRDFVDEWLTRPWSQMESRSAADRQDKLKKWHELLSGDFVGGDFRFVQQCRERADQWQVAIDLGWISGKEVPEALTIYFLIQQSEQYRFKMLGVSFDRQDGCPGESPPVGESPTLFPPNDKKR